MPNIVLVVAIALAVAFAVAILAYAMSLLLTALVAAERLAVLSASAVLIVVAIRWFVRKAHGGGAR